MVYQATASVMARLAIHQAETCYARDVIRWLDNESIHFASKFRNCTQEDPWSFHLSANFSLYPHPMYHLKRSFFFFCILLCVVPIWVAVMIGLEIGWSWRPRWTDLIYLGPQIKFCFLWTTLPGFGVCRVWLAFTVLSTFSISRTIWSNFKVKRKWDLRIMFDYGEILSSHTTLMMPMVLCHSVANSFFSGVFGI